MKEHSKAFNARKPLLSHFPDEVNIETVFGCNLKCRMCIMKDLGRFAGGRHIKFMESAVFENIIGQVSDKPRTICLNQNGEPLLHPEIVNFVQMAKAHGHCVYFVTNGTRLDEALADRLINAGLDRIIFSIDGIRKKVYERIRVGGDFDAVMTNTLRFIEMAGKSDRGIKVEVHCILSDLTQPDQEHIEQFWKDKAQLAFLLFDDWGGFFDGSEDDFGRPRTKMNVSAQRYPCDYLWKVVTVSAEGRVLYCCHDYKQTSNLPTVMDVRLLDVWRGEIAREREKHVKNAIDSLPCSQCDTWMTRPERHQTKVRHLTGRLYHFACRLASKSLRTVSPRCEGIGKESERNDQTGIDTGVH